MAAQASGLNAEGRFREVVALVERFDRAVQPLALLSYEAGYAHNRLGEIDKALLHYTQAITLDGELASARYDRGELYLTQSRWKKAREDFETVIRVLPDHWAGHFRMAHLAGVAADPAGMEKHLTNAIRTGFDMAVVVEDPSWRGWAKDPALGAVLRKIIILYGDEKLLDDLGLQP